MSGITWAEDRTGALYPQGTGLQVCVIIAPSPSLDGMRWRVIIPGVTTPGRSLTYESLREAKRAALTSAAKVTRDRLNAEQARLAELEQALEREQWG